MIKAFSFPKIFHGNRTKIVEGKTATLQNLRLILLSENNESFGDPEYGTQLVEQLFRNNATILQDVVKDNIYETIINYVPEVEINKDDIEIIQADNYLTASVKVHNLGTTEATLLNINLVNMNTDY